MSETVATPQPAPSRPQTDRLTLVLRIIVGVLLGAVLLAAGWFGYAYSFSPEAIRHPQGTHYHFRLQIINGGTPVNFAGDAFQTAHGSDTCSAALTNEPIHFHDQLDQFVHVHWAHTTGGMVLKNYGWNFLNGPDNTLGYRFDKFPNLTRVAAHGQDLPKPPAGANYYVYVGNQETYWEQSWNDFLKRDLRDFFSAKPGSSTGSANSGTPTATSWLERFVPAASAHAGHNHDEATAAPTGSGQPTNTDDEQLTKLNDVLGSVVIFVQKDRPTDQQIKDRFSQLVPLPESTCGG